MTWKKSTYVIDKKLFFIKSEIQSFLSFSKESKTKLGGKESFLLKVLQVSKIKTHTNSKGDKCRFLNVLYLSAKVEENLTHFYL